MPNYNETSVAGTSRQRAGDILLHNALSGASIATFREQLVTLIPGRAPLAEPVGDLIVALTAEVGAEVMDVIDPATNLPTGTTITIGEAQGIVHQYLLSLYLHKAQQRDAAAAV